jgi:hypothetical protein
VGKCGRTLIKLVGWFERTRNPASSSVATLGRMLGFSLFIPAYGPGTAPRCQRHRPGSASYPRSRYISQRSTWHLRPLYYLYTRRIAGCWALLAQPPDFTLVPARRLYGFGRGVVPTQRGSWSSGRVAPRSVPKTSRCSLVRVVPHPYLPHRQ